MIRYGAALSKTSLPGIDGATTTTSFDSCAMIEARAAIIVCIPPRSGGNTLLTTMGTLRLAGRESIDAVDFCGKLVPSREHGLGRDRFHAGRIAVVAFPTQI
jgi:hypothetical protein